MASLLLSVAGASAGGALFGPIGAIAGRLVGAVAGSAIDQSLFGGGNVQRSREGPRLSDLDVMASTEGAPIVRAYGRARLAGQVIWATQLQEVVSTRTETSGGGGGKGFGSSSGASVTTTTTSYSYFANLAVALCEGPIGQVTRVWADGKPLDLSGINMRAYTGDETQSPDPLIVAKEGAGNAPAYRGAAYVVFESLPLANFGNRIPQLSFEIVRPVGTLEQKVRAITLIPGATEFGYEPSTVVRLLGPGQSAPENRHVDYAPSDVEASLDALQAICPNLERVAIVIAWFADDLRAGECRIRPGVDNSGKATHGATWSVAGVLRGDAYLVSQYEGRPAFGGTPSDQSIINLIAAVKSRGLGVTLYPFVMMDIPVGNTLTDPWSGAASQPTYPWRGEIICDPAPGQPGSPDGTAGAATQVAAFFSGGADAWNYRNMILHYADLAAAAGGVDGFLIGSEFKSLTRVRSAAGVYPAVEALVTLAEDVKTILGTETQVSYAADWTEYGAHVVDPDADEVRFPLDPLWASAAIDAVGIDYYAPLADWRDTPDHLDRALATSIYDRTYLAGNLAGGEGYDWFYADDDARAAQMRSDITDGLGKPWIFRAKDIWNFWSQPHYERVGGAELASPTAWVPESKPIWISEVGCPAVNKGANQPSIFPDPKSATGGYPYFSSGRRDDLIQSRYLEAVIDAFAAEGGALNPLSSVYGEAMIDPSWLHLWTWDARPFPLFPSALDIWSDGGNWETGHWLTGRLGASPLEGLVGAILTDAGVTEFDASALGEGPDGYVIDRPMPPRAAIEPLALAYAFDAAEQNGILVFVPRGGIPVAEIDEDDLILPERGALCRLVRAQETELPREVSLGYTDSGADYRRAAVASRRLVGGAAHGAHADLAIVTMDTAAERRAEIWLQDLWAGRESAQFALPPSMLRLTPGDVIALTAQGRERLIEIREIVDTDDRQIKARSIDPEVFDLPLLPPRRRTPALPAALGPVHALPLDLPTLGSDEPPVLTRLAVFADPWPGPVAIWRSGDGVSYERAALAFAPSVVGKTLDDLPAGPTSRWDRGSNVRVQLYGGALASVSDASLFGGANAAAVQRPDGAWEVLQFANAELVGDRAYRLTRLLRGQGGSEWAMHSLLPAGAPFVLLDEHVTAIARGVDALSRPMQLRLVAAGRDHSDAAALAMEIVPGPTALRPLAPVHLKARRTMDGIALAWTRRARRDADSWALQDIPLDEPLERYEVDILDGATVLRTIASTVPNALYATADEIADFGAPQTSLTFRIAQFSATIGRGIPAETTITL